MMIDGGPLKDVLCMRHTGYETSDMLSIRLRTRSNNTRSKLTFKPSAIILDNLGRDLLVLFRGELRASEICAK